MNSYKGASKIPGNGIPASGMSGRVVNSEEGMSNPGNALPRKKSGGKGNLQDFRSVAAGKMMR